MPYDDVGAMGGLFAPAFIRGDPQSEAAVQKWQAANYAMTPAMIEQTRGPAVTLPQSGAGGLMTGLGRDRFGGGGSSPVTQPGAVDPEALRVLAQGGHYDMDARRNAIAKQVMAQAAPAIPAATPFSARQMDYSSMMDPFYSQVPRASS